MPPFVIHPKLREDSHVLGRLPISHLLLHRNAHVPWFILVPEVEVRELFQVPAGTRAALSGELDAVSRFVWEHFHCDKLNVAAIGNLVSQLHLHVVGRRVGDACWPGVVWGRLEPDIEYEASQINDLLAALGALPGFSKS